jgi:hypothetical protein
MYIASMKDLDGDVPYISVPRAELPILARS